jgi:mannosyltransferase OCH1-like enzyme
MKDGTDNRPSIVQYWHSEPPVEVGELMDTWQMAAEQDFEYRRFNDALALDFIDRHFDGRTKRAYLACGVPAMRADVFRICALLIRPGVYVDADMKSTGRGRGGSVARPTPMPLLPLYSKFGRGILLRRGERIANGFMIVKAAWDPLLRVLLDRAVNNIERRISNNVCAVTGPWIITRLWRELGPLHTLFNGFEMLTVDELSPYVRMIGNLQYKKTTDHWVVAQRGRSIFIDAPLPDLERHSEYACSTAECVDTDEVGR